MEFDFNFTLIAAALLVVFVYVTATFLARIYRRCPSNKILAVYGRVGSKQSARCYHGGGTFVWPLIQDAAFLDLTPRTIHIPLKGALSFQNIRINVPSTFTVAIGTEPGVMNNAAVRLLGLSIDEIESMAAEIIVGQLRLTVASLRIEEINGDRERFLDSIRKNVEPELHKVGLTLLNVNVTDITDESGYIESIGRKAVATAVNQAKVDVAEQEKSGAIGAAAAEQEQRIQVASAQSRAISGENEARANIAETNASLAEREAEASMRGRVAEQEAFAKVQQARAHAETSRLEAEELVPEEIKRRRIQIEAQAEADKAKMEAIGEAEAHLTVKRAEAEGIRQVMQAKAEGYRQIVEACGGNVREASVMLLIEKLEELVQVQVEAIKNLKIDKITVWDSGANGNSTTANFVSNIVKSLPALHDIAGMAGLELPDFLGQVQDRREEPPIERVTAVVDELSEV
ncbi:MAG: flotillin family protein [Chlamydiia bacterium]|nr:flotillin family protein [Chlamydiia bacterium]